MTFDPCGRGLKEGKNSYRNRPCFSLTTEVEKRVDP